MHPVKLVNESVPVATPVAIPVSPSPLENGLTQIGDEKLKGIVVRQEFRPMAGAPVRVNSYVVSALPEHKKVKSTQNDAAGWSPNMQELRALEPLLFIQEQPNIFYKAGMYFTGTSSWNAPLTLTFTVRDGGEAFVVERYNGCCGCCLCCTPCGCCCNGPPGMHLFKKYQELPQTNGPPVYEPRQEPVLVGKVVEDFENWTSSCIRCCCLCTDRHNIQRAIVDASGNQRFVTEYVVTVNQSCCGPNSSGKGCVGIGEAVFVIYDKDGKECGLIHKTDAGEDCCTSCCQGIPPSTKYLLEFPPNATTPEDRMLILTSILQLDYQLFEEGDGSD